MNQIVTGSIISLTIRLITTFGQLGLIVVLGKALTMTDLGIYGLITSCILISGYVIGFDIYQYNTREILNPDNNITAQITKQITFQLIIYFVIAITILPLIYFNPWDIDINIYILALLIIIFDHFSLESFRLFITLETPVLANILFFLRKGLWALAIAVIFFTGHNNLIKINSILLFWLISVIITSCVSLWILFHNKHIVFKGNLIDLSWIKNSVQIAFPFFISTLLYQVTLYINRYILVYLIDLSNAGIFTFFQTIANILHLLIYTSIISQLRPKIIRYYNQNELHRFRKYLFVMGIGILLISTFIILLIIITIDPFMNFMGKDELIRGKNVLYILLIGSVIMCITYVPSTILYVMKDDKIILWGNILGFISSIVFGLILVRNFGLIGAPLSMLSTQIICLAFFWHQIIKRHKDLMPVL